MIGPVLFCNKCKFKRRSTMTDALRYLNDKTYSVKCDECVTGVLYLEKDKVQYWKEKEKEYRKQNKVDKKNSNPTSNDFAKITWNEN